MKKCALLLDENIKIFLILLCFTLSVHEKICVRCGNKFIVYPTGKYARQEECTYHWAKAWKRKGRDYFERSINISSLSNFNVNTIVFDMKQHYLKIQFPKLINGSMYW